MLQDLGSTFGPRKLNHEAWSRLPVFVDADRCVVSMRDLPYNGATFVDAPISEEGRLIVARRLRALSGEQIRDLFEGAAFPDPENEAGDRDGIPDVNEWVWTLEDKIEQISARPPCPAHLETSP
jgi:hypothetical protein